MNLDFINKHVLITGGASGIGYEIARQFGDSGAMLSLFDYNEKILIFNAIRHFCSGFS